ncbi:hypothetical protein Tco_0834301 [Tanacetum coccineum]
MADLELDYKPSIQMIELDENHFRSLLGAKICSSREILTGCLGKLTSYLMECKLDDEIRASYDDEEAHVLSLKEFLICQEEDYVNASQTHSDLAMIVLRFVAIHFLDKLLLYGHQERPVTKEAMIAITRKGDFKIFSDGNRFYN